MVSSSSGASKKIFCGICCIFLALCCSTLGQELPLDGSQSGALSFNPANDPFGDVDNYKLLQQADVEGQWSKDDGRNASEKMDELLTFNSILHIDVKLVGFDGDGNFGVRVAEAELLRYFETVLEEHEKEAMVLNTRPGEPHRLPLRRKFFFRVLKARKGLSDELSSRIRSWLLTTSGVGTSDQALQEALRNGVQVPVDIVDELIRKDYVESELSGTHTIYLLNPKRVVVGGGAKPAAKTMPVFKEKPDTDAPAAAGEEQVLAYWYNPPPDDKPAADKSAKASPPAPAAGSAGGADAGCGTTMWAGNEERYMWIDLTAGPITYGPQTSGDGLVSYFTVPHLNNFMVDDFVEEDPQPAAAAAGGGRAAGIKQLHREHDHGAGGPGREAAHGRYASSHHYAFMQDYLAEVVALVGKTCDLLIEPSLDHFPVPLAKNLNIHLVHITDDPAAPVNPPPRVPLWEAIQEELGPAGARIAVQGQTITYSRSMVRLHGCRLCLAAHAAALRSHTSTVLRGQLKTQVHEYMDSKELHAQLSAFLSKSELHFADDLGLPPGWTPAAADPDAAAGVGGRGAGPGDSDAFREQWTVPVILWDLKDTSLVLLDRFHQAASFPDMVLALQTRAGDATVDFACNGAPAALRAGDASRAGLAALLQTAWGVAPTHEHHSGKTNRSETSYLWSAARTPFGPFSRSRRLGFALRDAARRNLVFSALNASVARVHGVLAQFDRFGKRMEDVLLPAEHVHFVRRWNVLRFKMQRASTYLSLLNFNTALFYARSLRHDVRAISNTVIRAGHFVHSYLGCIHDEQPSVLRLLVYLFGVSSLVIMAYVGTHALLTLRRTNKPAFKKKL